VVESDANSWAQRVWALPFLTVLAPSQRYHEQRNHRHKQLTDWARQMIRQVRRLPANDGCVADSSFAALELLWALCQMSKPVHITAYAYRCYQPAPLRRPKQMGRPEGGQAIAWSESAVNNPHPWQTVEMKDWYGQG